jgi:hypothetical protein
VGRLQYLAGCPVSWRCDMTSKRATKSKLRTRKEMAKARNLEIYSSRGKGHARAREGGRAGSGLARAGTGLSFHSYPLKPELACISKAGQQKHYSLRTEAGGPRQKHLRESVAIVALTYRFAWQWFYQRKNPSWEIITAR